MRPRLIALDMDGTMLDGEGRLTPRLKAAFAAAQDLGVRIVAATGRMYPSAMMHLGEAGIKSASIFYNGALIRDTEDGRTIYERRVGKDLTAGILSFFRERGWYIHAYSDDKLIVVDDSDERCRYYEKLSGQKAVAYGEKFWDSGLDSSKLLGISFDGDEFMRMGREVREAFGGSIYQATTWGAFLEMVHPSVNKANALERVCRYYGVPREEAAAIGDGINDIEMIKWAGTGIAMGNSKEAVKAAADIIAPPNTEEGAARIIERLIAS